MTEMKEQVRQEWEKAVLLKPDKSERSDDGRLRKEECGAIGK